MFVYIVSHLFTMAEYLKGFIFHKISGLVSHSISLGQVVYSPYWPKDIPKSLQIAPCYRPCLKPGVWMTRWATKGSMQVSGSHSYSHHSENMWLTLTLWVGGPNRLSTGWRELMVTKEYWEVKVWLSSQVHGMLLPRTWVLFPTLVTGEEQPLGTLAPGESMPLASSATSLKCIRLHTHKHN